MRDTSKAGGKKAHLLAGAAAVSGGGCTLAAPFPKYRPTYATATTPTGSHATANAPPPLTYVSYWTKAL